MLDIDKRRATNRKSNRDRLLRRKENQQCIIDRKPTVGKSVYCFDCKVKRSNQYLTIWKGRRYAKAESQEVQERRG